MIFQTGDVLRKWRGDRWTVEALAERAGLDKNTISRAERNQPTRTDTLEQIVTALGHTMAELHAALGQIDPADAAHITAWKALSEESREYLGRLIRRTSELEASLRAHDDAGARDAGGGARSRAPRPGSARTARNNQPKTGGRGKRSREDDADRA